MTFEVRGGDDACIASFTAAVVQAAAVGFDLDRQRDSLPGRAGGHVVRTRR
ncbi:MAG: hypothetical protein ACTHQQ_23570 [Solirubrobacteraceae bacterium]